MARWKLNCGGAGEDLAGGTPSQFSEKVAMRPATASPSTQKTVSRQAGLALWRRASVGDAGAADEAGLRRR